MTLVVNVTTASCVGRPNLWDQYTKVVVDLKGKHMGLQDCLPGIEPWRCSPKWNYPIACKPHGTLHSPNEAYMF
jgi:hypothetical protein